MYALVIGASSESVYAINRARSYGMKVLAFDGDKGAEGLKYADESFVVDIRDPEKIYSIIDRKRIHPEEMVVLPVPIGRYLIRSSSNGIISANSFHSPAFESICTLRLPAP